MRRDLCDVAGLCFRSEFMLKKIKFALSEGILHNKKTLIAEPGKE